MNDPCLAPHTVIEWGHEQQRVYNQQFNAVVSITVVPFVSMHGVVTNVPLLKGITIRRVHKLL